MELEKLKSMWQEQNNKLNENLNLNNKILENTFKQQANGVVERLLRWEYFSLIEFIIFLIFMGVATYKSMNDWRFLVSGMFIVGFLALCVIISIQNIQMIIKINLFSNSIVETKRTILKYQKIANKGLKIFLYTIPLVILTFILVGVNFVRGINLFDYPVFFSVLAASIILVSYIIAIISNKTIFTRKFIQINNSLEELEKFIKE
jgi:hypothetical protein